MPATSNRNATVWYASDLGGGELLRARFRNHVYPPHSHETVCLGLITGGAIEIKAQGQRVTATRGTFVLIDSEVVHAGWPATDDGWKMRTLHLAPDILTTMAAEEARRRPAKIALAGPTVVDSEVSRLFYGIHWCSEVGGPSLKRDEYFQKLLMRLFHRYTKPAVPDTHDSAEPVAVAAAKEYLRAHYTEKTTLRDLAELSGLTPFRMLRSFLHTTGMTPHTWQTDLRVRSARALLQRGAPPAEVAVACGFSDQAHLTRVFRRFTGTTPGLYRAAF